MSGFRGDIDTTYHTQQRDMFSSGLAAEIGVHAFAVWHAIKSHADFQTGVAWPSIRRIVELTGCADKTVQAAIKTLVAAHLLRVSKKGQRNIYVARERMDVRVGDRVICTVVIDFVPKSVEERPWGPPPSQWMSREEVDASMAEAGLVPRKVHGFLTEQFFVEYAAAP